MKEFFVPALVPAAPQDNATQLLVDRLAKTPDSALFAVPEGDGWRDITTREFYDQVMALAKGLMAQGVKPGERVGIMCKTRYEWTLVDFAIWFTGAVSVPVYETSSPHQIHHILGDADAHYFIVESAEHFTRFDEVSADLPNISKTWQIDLGDLTKLMESGGEITDEAVEEARNIANGDDIATIIYTSGSSGAPKGCALSHSNFVELSRNASASMPEVVAEGASTLLFVTIAHVFARFISVLAVEAGVKVGHQPDTSQLIPSLSSFKPSFLLVVPRVLEKVYNSAEQTAESGGKGKIFRSAAQTAVEYSKALDAGKVPFGLKFKFKLFDKLVYSKLKEKLGGRVKYAISGSAPLGLFLGHFFRSHGIQILEGYGLTETTAPATVNVPSKFKIGTVGPALPGVGIKIAEDGEVLVKGINIFKSYHNNDEEMKNAFDGEWFKTGDIGEIDSDGYLTITGRKKELIITAGGKNVSPAILEDPIRANTLVNQVIVIGDQKPFISALITLDTEMLPVWLNNNDEDPNMSLKDAAKHPKVLAEIQDAIDKANKNVSRAESIRKFVVLSDDLSIESGHLTPKLSVKRHVILDDYASVVDSIYAAHPPTEGTSIQH